MKRYSAKPSACLVVVTLVACGGGGGGGGAGSGGGGGGGTDLVYAGSTSAAIITTTNAGKLTTDVLGGQAAGTLVVSASNINAAASARRPGIVDVVQHVSNGVRVTARTASGVSARRAVGVAIDETTPCDSGSIHFLGSLADTPPGAGILTATYNSCLQGSETLNGEVNIDVTQSSISTGDLIDFTVRFSSLAVHGPGEDSVIGGSVRIHSFGAQDTFTANIVIHDNIAKEMTKTENFIITTTLNPTAGVAHSEMITGRLFDSILGFVDVTTPVPLAFSSMTQDFPNAGRLQLVGASNRSVAITALSATLIRFDLDLNGDGLSKISARLPWVELGTPASSDLGDDDNDGMHNSWESAHGFDRSNPGDASVDSDGDGFSNLVEYQAGTNPKNGASQPTTVTSLEMSVTDSADPVITGTNFVYTLSVFNAGPGNPNTIEIRDRLPAGVTFVSAIGDGWACSNSADLLICTHGSTNLSTISVSVTVTAPSTVGIISNTATVSSDIAMNGSKGSATQLTTVGTSMDVLQAQIDAAAPGSTVVVPPGIYVGSLDFHGKDVAFRSSDGPDKTILINSSGRVVQIGPAGSISGFTISGLTPPGPSRPPTPPGSPPGPHGGGIEVTGAGTVISDNIIEEGTVPPGSHGSAIGGVSVSPTIERNIFRNNSAPDVPVGGVVVFEGVSSAIIRNNVFHNNAGRAMWLFLTSGSAAIVSNNTFVANLKGIKVSRGFTGLSAYRNNILAQNGTGLELEFSTDADNPIWENNLVFANTVDYQGTTVLAGSNGNISADPLFVNATAGNYRLQLGSPAIDAGTAVGAPTVDFDGIARPVDGDGNGSAIIDIGAFEFH